MFSFCLAYLLDRGSDSTFILFDLILFLPLSPVFGLHTFLLANVYNDWLGNNARMFPRLVIAVDDLQPWP
jgi:hypothetical protein